MSNSHAVPTEETKGENEGERESDAFGDIFAGKAPAASQAKPELRPEDFSPDVAYALTLLEKRNALQAGAELAPQAQEVIAEVMGEPQAGASAAQAKGRKAIKANVYFCEFCLELYPSAKRAGGSKYCSAKCKLMGHYKGKLIEMGIVIETESYAQKVRMIRATRSASAAGAKREGE